MRWMLSFTVPLLLLLCVPADANAQADTIPLTVTLEQRNANRNISSVSFPSVSTTIFYPHTSKRIQHLVRPGVPGPDTSDRFRLEAEVHVGNPSHGHTFPYTISFAKESTCKNGPGEGKIKRIACAIVAEGDQLICTAFYSGMESPPDTCEGTQACVRCAGGLKVCGSDPQCD